MTAVAPQSLIRITPRVENPAYLAFLRTQPCCICEQSWGIEASHTGARGLSQKASDLDALPLCRRHHRFERVGLDRIGKKNWQQWHRVSIPKLILIHQTRAKACGVKLYPTNNAGCLADTVSARQHSGGRRGR